MDVHWHGILAKLRTSIDAGKGKEEQYTILYHTAQYNIILYTVYCIVYTVYCIVYTVYCILYSAL